MAERQRQQYIDSILKNSEESQSQRTFLETLSLDELEELLSIEESN